VFVLLFLPGDLYRLDQVLDRLIERVTVDLGTFSRSSIVMYPALP
jgi:hypothetical protein